MSGDFSAETIRGEGSAPSLGPPRTLDAAPDASIVQLSTQFLRNTVHTTQQRGRGKGRTPQNA